MDLLSQAIAAAQARYPGGQWSGLPPKMQTEAIYRELRRLDRETLEVAAASGSTSTAGPFGSGST